MHCLHDYTHALFCFDQNAIKFNMPLQIIAMESCDVRHPNNVTVITITNKELQVLESL